MELRTATQVRDRNRADLKRAKVAEIKIRTGCVDCGYNLHHAALEFDHLPEFAKSQTVASLCYRSWSRIEEEIAKCEIVCANCHAIRTYNRNKGL